MTKAEFARTYKIPGGASMVSQHLSGNRPISMDAAIAYARGFGCSIADISPRLAAEAKALAQMVNDDLITNPTASHEHEEDDSDSISIDLMNAYGSMGGGVDIESEDLAIERLRINRAWAAENLKPITSLNNLYFIHALGDSMTPTLDHGDIVLVDAGIKNAMVDGIYVLRASQRLFIKRVRTRLDGAHEISSDNPNVKTVDILNGDHDVEIVGKVVWVWNGKKV